MATATDYANLSELFNDPQFMSLPVNEKVAIYREVAQKDTLYRGADRATQQEVVRRLFPEAPGKPALEPRISLDPRTAEGRTTLGMTLASGLAGGALAGPPGAVAFAAANLLGEEGTRRLQEEFGNELGTILGLIGGVVSGGGVGMAGRPRPVTAPSGPVPPGATIPGKPGVPHAAAPEVLPPAKPVVPGAQLSQEQRAVLSQADQGVSKQIQTEQLKLGIEVPPSRARADVTAFGPSPPMTAQSSPARIQEIKDELYTQYPKLRELQSLAPPEGRPPLSARRLPDGSFPLDVLVEQHNLAQEFINPASLPAAGQAPKLVIVTGLPGSGKTEIIVKRLEAAGPQFTKIDSDAIKARLPGYDHERPWVQHDEATVIGEQIVLPRALQEGRNILFDGVGRDPNKLIEFAKQARIRGYEVEVYNIASDVAFSLQRAGARSLKPNGRNVPFGYIEGLAGKPEEAYTQLRRSGYADRGKSWINPGREAPREELASTFTERDSFGSYPPQHELSLGVGRRPAGRGDRGLEAAQRPSQGEAAAPAVPTAEAVTGPAQVSLHDALTQLPPTAKQAVTADLVEGYLRVPQQEKIVNAAKTVFQQKHLVYDPDIPPSLQILKGLERGEITVPELEALGLTKDEIAGLYGPAKQFAGRTLNLLSQLDRLLAGDSLLQKELRGLADKLDNMGALSSLWRRLDNVRRGLMVSQLTTAVRNFETQMGRVGLDVLQAPIDGTIQKFTGLPQTVHPLDGWERVMNIFRRGTKKDVEAILEAFPSENERMFLRYNADIVKQARKAGVEVPPVLRAFDRADEVVGVLNWANRGQEFITRRGIFQATLDQRLRQKGVSLEAIIQRGEIGKIPEEDIAAAVTKALDVTFARNPSGPVGRAFVNFFTSVPGASFVIPFPRFMVNSLKFLFEYNPTGILRYLSAGERAALASGNTEGVSKAILGSALLGVAWQIRQSENAGEKYYEWRTDEGNIVDLRPFNPFLPYLFVADVIKRKQEGTLNQLTTKDLAMGLLSTSLRAGTGLYMLDKAMEGIIGERDPEDALRYLKEFGGEVIATFGTPLSQITDLLGEFDDYYTTIKERRVDPLTGPLKARAPFLGETQETEIPTRAGPVRRVHPFLYRQLAGATVTEPKNPVERELDRLGFSRPEILRGTGDPDLDLLTARYMGPVVEQAGEIIVSSERYLQSSDKGKGVILSAMLEVAREEARGLAKTAQGPEPGVKRRLESLPKRIRALLKERGIFGELPEAAPTR